MSRSVPPAVLAGVQHVSEAVRAAYNTKRGVRIRGAGTWMDAGRPVAADDEISLAGLSGIVEYVPGDLTLTALAGTSLRDIAAATAKHGQWLPLDPPGSDTGTLGATAATASYGPLALAHGTPRDQILGVQFVSGLGQIARGGGRVTKNVAGFDITRLLIGSWGTLGVITEVSVRLWARPEVDQTVALQAPADPAALGPWIAACRAAPLAPLALELLDASLAHHVGLGATPTLLARLGGNADSVTAQRRTLATLGDIADVNGDVWSRLRTCEGDGAWTWRLSDLPTVIADTWASAIRESGVSPRPWLHANIGRGIVRCIAAPGDAQALIAAIRGSSFKGRRVYERVPAAAWVALTESPLKDPVSHRLKQAFDPAGILNPGRYAEAAR